MTTHARAAMRRLRARHGLGAVTGVFLALVVGSVALAYWTTTGGGTSTAGAATLGAPTGVTATAPPSSTTVSVGFTGVTPPGGTLDGYYVTRYLGAVPSNACGTNPAVPGTYLSAAATSCADTGVANGTYTYRVTAVFRSWTAQSAASAPVTVVADATPPTQVVSLTSGSGTAYLSGTNVFFRPVAAGAFTLSSAVTDSSTGPASATFPAIATTGWTHNAETVTSGTGGPTTITYTSSTFSWTASPSTPGSRTVTGADVAGNTVGTALTFTPDSTGPTGGALTVGGVVGTAGGASGYSTTGTYTGTRTDYNADAGSGLATSVLTRAVAPLVGGACGTYAAPTTVIGNPSETTAANGCYRYTLTGTDRVGNTSSLTSVIQVDRTAPTQAFSATSTNASVTGTTLYYKGNVAGSLVLNAIVTDSESGPKQAAFPAIATTGWTHNAETVTTGTGTVPTITYPSSTYSWTANPTNPTTVGARTVTSSDQAGNTVATALTFASDITAPTGGALTVNGTGALVGGTSSYSTSGTYTGTRTDFTDAASGIASSALTRQTGTLSNGICSAYGAATVIVGPPNETNLATGCYRYVLTGTDNVGNTTSLTTVVMVDRAAPTQAIAESGANAYYSGGVLYYRGNVAGSFTLTDAVTDGESGPKQALFPAIATTGWTHNAETVTTSTGTLPTLTYASSAFSWTANPTNPTGYAITGSDQAGNTVVTPLTFSSDTTLPVSGALTVNGTGAVVGGTTSASSTGTYTGTRTNFTDAGSGIASSALTREVGTLSNGVCSAYGSPTTVPSNPSETNAATGCYRYVLTGTDNVGNTTSLTTVVQVDRTAPTQTVTETGADAFLSGTTLYYRSGSAGSFTLTSAVTDGQGGPASAAFPAIGAAGWSHAAETVTSGTGAIPTISYTSSAISWTANPTNPGSYVVTGADAAGNTVGTTLTLTPDATGPTGGALTVGGVVGTSGGATGYSANGTYTGVRTNFNADAGSGFVSSVLTREVGTLSNGTCSAYGAPTTLAGNPSETNVAAGCYRYTLTGTDNVGNTSVLSVEIEVDKTAPTQVLSASGNGSVTGTTVYYKRGTAGSMILTSTVTDTQSGPKQVTFPAMPAGWTHPAETVIAGTGSNPTIAYSSTYSWTANPNNPNAAARTFTAADQAGNTVANTYAFTADNSAPTGGALTVNGTAASAGGSTSTSTTGAFTATRTNYSADTGSGLDTSILTREDAALVNGVCGTYGSPSVVAGAPNETGLASGCYRYTLTGTDKVGNVASLTTVVRVDADAPTQVVTMGGGAGVATLSGTTVYYKAGVAGSFTLTSTLTDGESGPSQVVFPAIGATGWTHANQTVTPGTGSGATRTYTSTTFSWTANPSVPAAYTVTGSDANGNTVTTVLTFVPDATGPTGGALTVNGTAGTSGTPASTWSSTGTFTGTFTPYSADAGAGFASSTLTRAYTATLTNGVCGAFGAATTITSISETNAAAGCYRYTLTGTDVFGNTSSLAVDVEVDKTNPTQTLTATGNGYVSGGTLYWRSAAPGSFTLTANVTDAQSGPGSATFPVLTTAGWTHAAETVTAGTGGPPTTAFTSTSYAWTAGAATPSATERAVTGRDLAGNSVTTTLTYTADNSAPTGGALTVNGTAATAGGSTSSTNATSWTIGTRTDYTADTGSGMASSVLTRERAVWNGTTCGVFDAPVTVTGTAAQTGMIGGSCYRYVLTGTDNVGNTSTLTTTVRTGVVVSSVTLSNGPNTAGTLNQGDTINITFSGPLAVASMCSTWSDDAANQSVTGNNVVGVTIRGGTGTANDYMEVTTSSAACGGSFNFGTLLLGDDGYLVSTTVQTFRGTGTNQSTIAYDASTYTLTITLGRNETTPGVDGSNNVNGNTVAVYTPSSAIDSVGGLGITGTGSTANVRQF